MGKFVELLVPPTEVSGGARLRSARRDRGLAIGARTEVGEWAARDP